jgi:hypothetical protein
VEAAAAVVRAGQEHRDFRLDKERAAVQISNSATGQTVIIRADNVVSREDGHLLVEAMFSSVVDLTGPAENLAARLHPSKARAFEWIVTGQSPTVTSTGGQPEPAAECVSADVNVVPDVQLHVNQPAGDTVVRHFSECLEHSRQLLNQGSCPGVQRTIVLAGFEPDGEPVLRQMQDGSFCLVFACLPPLATETDPEKAKRFDMNAFGEEIQQALKVAVAWDDREVFVIPQPDKDTVERLQQFLAEYWTPRKKKGWKFW